MEVAGIPVPHPDEVFVAGEWVPATGGGYDVVSPATEQLVAEVAVPGSEQIDAAVRAAAEDGWRTWPALPVAERAEICGRWFDLVKERAADLDLLWAVEAGMPLRYGNKLFRFATTDAWTSAVRDAGEVMTPERRTSGLGDVLIHREAAGVVVAILPSNGPVVTIASKAIPALLAGCPVIVKGAPESNLVLRVVAECARLAGFPDGAVSILCGDADLGRALTRDERVDMVSLTGGGRAAQDVIDATQGRFARTQLELGGKSPALILDDAPIDAVLRALLPGATSGTGQVCALLSRVLVPEHRHDEIVDAMRQAWERLVIGDPTDSATQIGPLLNKTALERTNLFVEHAVADGGRLVTGGSRPPGLDVGWYVQPTLLTGIAADSELAQCEVFGPVTAVQTYRDLDEGIRLANHTPYGLSAAVFSADRELALHCASRIRAGSVAINTFGPAMSAPFGGMKQSGWGRESGPEGIRSFTELKQILLGPA